MGAFCAPTKSPEPLLTNATSSLSRIWPWVVTVNSLPAEFCENLDEVRVLLERKLDLLLSKRNVAIQVVCLRDKTYNYHWESLETDKDLDKLMKKIRHDFEEYRVEL